MRRLLTVLVMLILAVALGALVISVAPGLIRSLHAPPRIQAHQIQEPQRSPPPPSQPHTEPIRGILGPIFAGGPPVAAGYPHPVTLLERVHFSVAYDEIRANPAWAAYRITLDHWDEEWERPSRFSHDPRTRSGVTHDTYTNTGYDRGHLAPNEAISESYGRSAQLETFLVSNIMPQRPALNQGPWRALEEDLVNRVQRDGPVWVITGPIYDEHVERLPGSQVEIPDACFKVVLDEHDGDLVLFAVIMPQEAGRRDDYHTYRVTVDTVERASGWDFFSELPDEIEAALEAASSEPW